MTAKPSKPRRFRRHGDAPANWQYRDGRPRWIPAPGLRKAGWRARDLKDAAGVWLSEGLSRDAARAINDQVAAWRRGEQVSAHVADMAPVGAALTPGEGALPVATDRLSIGRLVKAYVESREFLGALDARGQRAGGLASRTQAATRQGLKRFVDALAGFARLPDKTDPAEMARYAYARALVEATSATTLAPVETPDGMVQLLYDAYWALYENAGKHQAYRVFASVSGWLSWCQKHQSKAIRRSWAADVSRETPPGRIRPWTVEEFTVMVATADRMGWRSIGDSIVLGLDLSWSQVDRLALTWSRLKDFRAFTGAAGRAKTGRVGGTPLTGLGRARVAAIIVRQAAMPAQPTHVLWCETTNAPWHRKTYGDRFAEVRAEAAKTCPSLLDDKATGHLGAWDADLRDTAFTWMKNAGLDNDGIASRTIQSRKLIAELGDKHYGEIGPEIADPAARKYDAYLRGLGLDMAS